MKFIKLLAPVLMLVFLCCKKESGTSNTVSLSDFPLAVGDTWTYQVFDSINNNTNNAVFTITGVHMLSGVPVNILNYTTQTVINGTVVDSGSIISYNDSVIYQPNGQGLFSNLTLLFPLTPNNKWHTQYNSDSVSVLASNISFMVLNNNYDSVYNVGRIESVPDLYIHQNLYIAPHIGIIQEALWEGSWVPVHKTLKLVSYTLH